MKMKHVSEVSICASSSWCCQICQRTWRVCARMISALLICELSQSCRCSSTTCLIVSSVPLGFPQWFSPSLVAAGLHRSHLLSTLRPSRTKARNSCSVCEGRKVTLGDDRGTKMCEREWSNMEGRLGVGRKKKREEKRWKPKKLAQRQRMTNKGTALHHCRTLILKKKTNTKHTIISCLSVLYPILPRSAIERWFLWKQQIKFKIHESDVPTNFCHCLSWRTSVCTRFKDKNPGSTIAHSHF